MYCRHCGNEIDSDVIICPKCGKQVQELKYSSSGTNINLDGFGESNQPKNKTLAIILCCIGFVCVAGMHKFYEGKIGLGILYLLTGGLFFIGTIIDLLDLLDKPDQYYV